MKASIGTRVGPGRRRRLVALAAATSVMVLLLAACSSTTTKSDNKPGSSAGGKLITAADVPAEQLQTAIKRIFLDDIPVSDVPPVVADTLAVGSTPLTAEQTALLKKCLSQTSCETGHGTLTVGINADFTNNPWWAVRRAEATAQAIAYPQVKKIIFTTSTAGNVAEMLANLRSLIAQQVDFIVEDPIFGGAILPAAMLAENAGIPFITENGPLKPSDESQVTTQFPFPLCSMAEAAVAKIVADTTTGNKTYGLVTGSAGNAFAAVWWPCAKDAFKAAGWTQVSEQQTDWTKQGEAQAANELLSSGKNPSALLYDSSLDNYLAPFIAQGKEPPASFQDTGWYSFDPIYNSAVAKGLKVQSYVSDGHVWYGRLGVTAGVEIAMGKKLPNKIEMPIAVVAYKDVPKIPGMPANTVFNPLLPPDLVQYALGAQ
jgi:ABC-type sugar transport system substrate-binding protein